MPLVSVIINTLDRAASLECTLGSLDQLRYPNFEVILVRGPCVDNTNEVISRYFGKVRIALCNEANLATSRNIAVAIAAGEIVAFLDDDAIPEPDWLDRLVEGFTDPSVAAVGGFIRDHTGVQFQYRNVIGNRFADVRHTASVETPKSPDEYSSPTGTNVAIRRQALIGVGGFDEEYAYFLEETDVNLRLHDEGWNVRVIPEAQVHHKLLANRIRNANRTPRSRYVIARSKAYFSWIHGSKMKSPRQIRAYLRSYRLRHAWYMMLLFALRRISWKDCTRLAEEINRGIVDGTRDAVSVKRRPALSPLTTGDCRNLFKRYPTKMPVERRLRICVLVNRDYRIDTDEVTLQIYATAQALAQRGHEVSVICLSDDRGPGVEFVCGVWMHRLTVHPLVRLYSRRARTEWVRLAEAGCREIMRIQDRRKFQMVLVPYDGRAISPMFRYLDLPVVAVRLFSRPLSRDEQPAKLPGPTPGEARVLALDSSSANDANLKAFEFQLSEISHPPQADEPGVEFRTGA